MSVLKNIGVQLNPYDMCVVNKYISGKQCTISWYVDDNKVSHEEQDDIDDFINKAEKMSPGLTVTKRNVNKFLWIKIRYLNNRRVAINIRE